MNPHGLFMATGQSEEDTHTHTETHTDTHTHHSAGGAYQQQALTTIPENTVGYECVCVCVCVCVSVCV